MIRIDSSTCIDRLREMWPISLSLRNPEFPYAERSAIFVDVFGNHKLNREMKFLYLLHYRVTKAQASLCNSQTHQSLRCSDT